MAIALASLLRSSAAAGPYAPKNFLLWPLHHEKGTGTSTIIVSSWDLNLHRVKYSMCTNSNKYATINTFMYPRCERARLSGYTVQTSEGKEKEKGSADMGAEEEDPAGEHDPCDKVPFDDKPSESAPSASDHSAAPSSTTTTH